MTQFPPARLAGVTFALFATLVTGSISAQTAQPASLATLASLALPEAPEPQTGTVAGQSGESSQGSQSSSAQSQPASPQAPPSSSQPAPPSGDPSAPAPNAADEKQKQHDEAERELKAQEKQRLLGVMPQFQVVMNGQAVPLTGGQKWSLALHSARDPFYIGWAFVIGGGWGELVDSNQGYGWGDAGYFKRVGANYADNVDGALIGNALLPQLLHQDPRYFRKGTGPIFKRFLYAAASTVVCRGDNGKNQANVSNVLGNFIAGGISNLYYPSDERGAELTVDNAISVTLFGALGGQILEFGPDLNRLAHHKKKAVPGPVGPASGPTQAHAPDKAQPPAANPDSSTGSH